MGVALFLALAAGIASLAVWIAVPPKPRFDRADAAIVLGAPLFDGKPSPVFQARIDHGVGLLKSGKAGVLIMTGGRTKGATIAEADAARASALRAGVPTSQILVEARSETTAGNLKVAAELMRRNRLHNALIVTDPIHLRRAMWLTDRAGIIGSPNPVPDSRYRGIGPLAHEIAAFLRDLFG